MSFKKLCVPCFPSSYHLFDYFVDSVHQVLSDYVSQLLDKKQLHGDEFFVLLSWQDIYKSTHFLGHPRLHIDTTRIPDILDETMYANALESFLSYKIGIVASWFSNALAKSYSEWMSGVKPLLIDEYFESTLPNDLNAIMIQQVFYSFIRTRARLFF